MSEIFIAEDFLSLVLEILQALAPIFVIFILFQVFVLKLSKSSFLNILKGFLFTYIGLVLFLYGVQIGFMPVGKYIGEVIGASSHRWILIPIGFLLGFVITIVEPAVRILCAQVDEASSGYIKEKTMLYTLSIGVAIAIALAMAKTLFGISLIYILIPGYIIAFILAFIAGPSFASIAFDSGGVATGPMTVTFILSISIGAATIMEGRDAILHGFGLVSIVALAPIIAVLVFGIIYQKKEEIMLDESLPSGEYTVYENAHDLIVIIVKRGLSEKVLDSAKKAGAEGGTIVYGRGTGIHEKAKLLGIPIEPEKEIIFLIIDKKITKKVLDSIVSSTNLNKPGVGIAFVIELSKVLGICHGLDCQQ